MRATSYRGRRAASVENEALRVTALVEGGHIAEVCDKRTGINPLWTPRWDSIEPSTFELPRDSEYGGPADGPLLAGIMGHNLCLDIFGGPSDEECAAGLTAHGEGSVVPYEFSGDETTLIGRADLPLAGLAFLRRLELRGTAVHIHERVTNLQACDRAIGWTQHVTLGPPFLKNGVTEFRSSAARSMVFEGVFGPRDYLQPGAIFDWPHAPRADGGTADLRWFTDAPQSSAYTAHLMDAAPDKAYFVAFDPDTRLAFGYAWQPADFPWMGIWEENRSRPQSPWHNREIARGMEFGVSPFPEGRRAAIARGRLFETPTYRWVPARTSMTAEYRIVVLAADRIPETLS